MTLNNLVMQLLSAKFTPYILYYKITECLYVSLYLKISQTTWIVNLLCGSSLINLVMQLYKSNRVTVSMCVCLLNVAKDLANH